MRIYGAPPIIETEPDPTTPAERLRDLVRLTDFALRSQHVLLELQAMAAVKYWWAMQYRASYQAALAAGSCCEHDRRARFEAHAFASDAAALSRLVRVGLGIEEP